MEIDFLVYVINKKYIFKFFLGKSDDCKKVKFVININWIFFKSEKREKKFFILWKKLFVSLSSEFVYIELRKWKSI